MRLLTTSLYPAGLKVASTSLWVGFLALVIAGGLPTVVFLSDLHGEGPRTPPLVQSIVVLVAMLLAFGGLFSIRYWFRLRDVVRTVSPVACDIHIEVRKSTDSTSFIAHVGIHGERFRVAVRGGRGLSVALEAGMDDPSGGHRAMAWVEPATGLPILLAVAHEGEALRLDTYGAARADGVHGTA